MKSDKIRKSKIIKKVSKIIKNGKTPFLGRKRKTRGSMRFVKNAPTRWLGKRIKWHLPLKVTYPPPFWHIFWFDIFLVIFIFSLLLILCFYVLSLLSLFLVLLIFMFLIKCPFFTIRPYYNVMWPFFDHFSCRGEYTQERRCYVVWWFSPLLLFLV